MIPLVIPPEIIPGIPITLHALRAKPTPGIMKKTILMASILALVTLSSPAQFSVGVGVGGRGWGVGVGINTAPAPVYAPVIVQPPMPAPYIKVAPVCPVAGYVWVGGSWGWFNNRWVWNRGCWGAPHGYYGGYHGSYGHYNGYRGGYNGRYNGYRGGGGYHGGYHR